MSSAPITPLDLTFIAAARNGDLPGVKSALQQGAELHIDRDTALRVASAYGHLDVVRFLVEQCGVSIHSQGSEAFHIAAQGGQLEIVLYFVEQGIDIHSMDDSALNLSALQGRIPVVLYLLDQGAPIIVAEHSSHFCDRIEVGQAVRQALKEYTELKRVKQEQKELNAALVDTPGVTSHSKIRF